MKRSDQKKIDPLNDRFIQVMERLGHTGYSLSKELGTSEAVISNIRKGKNPPNILLVQAILNKYEEVDAAWLLTGKGRMFRREQVATEEPKSIARKVHPPETVEHRLIRMEELLQRSIHVQLERNALTDESMTQMQRQLSTLDRKVIDLTKVRRKSA